MRDYGKVSVLALALLTLLMPGSALAYIGPGVGAGAIGAVLGVIGSILVGLFAVIWYPFKRLMKKRRQSKSEDGSCDSHTAK
jgi:membrane protein implicated in regulation of membrane protease activity